MAHKIVSGDTLYALCASYGLDYYAYSKLISLLNPNAAYYNLLPGNILYMPQYVAASTTVKPAATPAPAASAGTTAAPAATPAPSASAGTNGFRCAERHSRRFRQAHYDAQHPRRGYAQLSHHPAQDPGRRHRHEYLR